MLLTLTVRAISYTHWVVRTVTVKRTADSMKDNDRNVEKESSVKKYL